MRLIRDAWSQNCSVQLGTFAALPSRLTSQRSMAYVIEFIRSFRPFVPLIQVINRELISTISAHRQWMTSVLQPLNEKAAGTWLRCMQHFTTWLTLSGRKGNENTAATYAAMQFTQNHAEIDYLTAGGLPWLHETSDTMMHLCSMRMNKGMQLYIRSTLCSWFPAAIAQGGFSLMEGNALESELLQLVAHVTASRVLLERYESVWTHASCNGDPHTGCVLLWVLS